MFKLKHKDAQPFVPAFTLIELLVVIAIIGLLVTLSVLALSNARVASRDSKRVSDVKQIRSALELYFDAANHYPTNAEFQSGSLSYYSSSTGTTTYMSIVPAAPTPADGNCSNAQNSYIYNAPVDGSTYTLNFCVSKKIGDLPVGSLVAFSGGIISAAGNGGNGGNGGGGGFVCGDAVSYGGESYSTVQIGAQCWFAKNLNVGTYIGSGNNANGFDGNPGTSDDCTDVYPGHGWWSCQKAAGIQKYCFDNNQADCVTDGGLYEWAEALGLPYDCNYAASVDNGNGTYTLSCPSSGTHTILSKQQGICPSGWHIPSDADWIALGQGLASDPGCDSSEGGCAPAGDKLKKASDCSNPGDPSCGSTGFQGILGGYRLVSGNNFMDRPYMGYVFSSTPITDSAGYYWNLAFDSSLPDIIRTSNGGPAGDSVRCLKD